jgi:hypothetical protein
MKGSTFEFISLWKKMNYRINDAVPPEIYFRLGVHRFELKLWHVSPERTHIQAVKPPCVCDYLTGMTF